MDKLEEELWTALKPFQSPDGTWLQVGKRDFEQACAVIALKQVEELERERDAMREALRDVVALSQVAGIDTASLRLNVMATARAALSGEARWG